MPDIPNGSRPRRQSAPVGGDWQVQLSRSMSTAAEAPGNGSSSKKHSAPAGTPRRRPGVATCELSPGGLVRRSARIAAYNIVPAADGDRAFDAIGALSQDVSFTFPDTPLTPVKAFAAPCRPAPKRVCLV